MIVTTGSSIWKKLKENIDYLLSRFRTFEVERSETGWANYRDTSHT